MRRTPEPAQERGASSQLKASSHLIHSKSRLVSSYSRFNWPISVRACVPSAKLAYRLSLRVFSGSLARNRIASSRAIRCAESAVSSGDSSLARFLANLQLVSLGAWPNRAKGCTYRKAAIAVGHGCVELSRERTWKPRRAAFDRPKSVKVTVSPLRISFPAHCCRNALVNSSKTAWNSFSSLLLIFLGLVVTSLALVIALGAVRGKQISPQTFKMRLYEYYRIPWSAIQITPVKYTQIPNDLVSFLADGGYLPSVPGPLRWDEVSYRAVGAGSQRGRAWVLASFLEMEDVARANWWLEWTKQHPERAKVLWKYVAQAAAERVYFIVPELMAAAKDRSRGIESLTDDLQGSLKRAYIQQIAGSKRIAETDRVEALKGASKC